MFKFQYSNDYCGGLKRHRRQQIRIIVTLVSAYQEDPVRCCVRFASPESSALELEAKTAAARSKEMATPTRPIIPPAAPFSKKVLKLMGSGHVSKPFALLRQIWSISLFIPRPDAFKLKRWKRDENIDP